MIKTRFSRHSTHTHNKTIKTQPTYNLPPNTSVFPLPSSEFTSRSALSAVRARSSAASVQPCWPLLLLLPPPPLPPSPQQEALPRAQRRTAEPVATHCERHSQNKNQSHKMRSDEAAHRADRLPPLFSFSAPDPPSRFSCSIGTVVLGALPPPHQTTAVHQREGRQHT
jgi:hypothetical protein